MSYEKIRACPNGCILFRKDYENAKYCPECGSSRFLEVDSGDGHKRHLDIPMKILRYLPFVPRLQRLYMIKETTKQMTWHKNGRRYNPNKLVHPSEGEAWTHFDGIHREKSLVALMYVLHSQQMGSILMDCWLPRTLVGPCLLSPSISPLLDMIFQ